ncbi:MAG TPA: hypothetical protein VJX16_12455 [Terriglobales bacterium]|nr:hypothetical protein [Terriglobales bacterium]
MPGIHNRNGAHNKNGNKNGNTNLWSLPSLSRGMYKRVAEKVGCDPSYVSRVARGERESKLVADALMAEIQRTWAVVNNGASRGKAGARRK